MNNAQLNLLQALKVCTVGDVESLCFSLGVEEPVHASLLELRTLGKQVLLDWGVLSDVRLIPQPGANGFEAIRVLRYRLPIGGLVEVKNTVEHGLILPPVSRQEYEDIGEALDDAGARYTLVSASLGTIWPKEGA